MKLRFGRAGRVNRRVRAGLIRIIGAFLAVCFFAVFAALSSGAGSEGVQPKSVQYYTGAGADAKLNSLDLYLPKAAQSNGGEGNGDAVPKDGFATVVFIHGGAWHIGDKSNDGPSRLAATLAENGIACANINYRLSPAVKHPVHVEDAARAVKWVYEHIAEYGGDPNRLFISGHSAGAHLAALVALDEKYLKAVGAPMSCIRGVIPISGPFDLTRDNENFKKFCKLEGAFGLDAAVLKDASPFTHVLSDAPPFLCFAAQFDSEPIRDDAENLAKALNAARAGAGANGRNAGVDARSVIVRFRNHMTIVRKFGARRDVVFKETTAFIKEHEA